MARRWDSDGWQDVASLKPKAHFNNHMRKASAKTDMRLAESLSVDPTEH